MKAKIELESLKAALVVLKDVKTCLVEGDTYTKSNGHSFNLHKNFGLCWHVFSGTIPEEIGGCGREFLIPLFLELGYDPVYPVEVAVIVREMQSRSEEIPHFNVLCDFARKAFSAQRDLYTADNEYSKQRCKLVDELIALIENKFAS